MFCRYLILIVVTKLKLNSQKGILPHINIFSLPPTSCVNPIPTYKLKSLGVANQQLTLLSEHKTATRSNAQSAIVFNRGTRQSETGSRHLHEYTYWSAMKNNHRYILIFFPDFFVFVKQLLLQMLKFRKNYRIERSKFCLPISKLFLYND